MVEKLTALAFFAILTIDFCYQYGIYSVPTSEEARIVQKVEDNREAADCHRNGPAGP